MNLSKLWNKLLVIVISLLVITSCTKRLENSSAQMAETSTALQQSTKQQMDELLKIIDSLTKTIESLDKNFFTLVLVLQQMQIDLNELAKVSEPVRNMLTQMNSVLDKLFEKEETPNQPSEDLDELLKD
jgi:methyl-accepting chemotaxis protein